MNINLMMRMGGDEMSNLDPLMSSKNSEWETPQSFFDDLHCKFNFVYDVACTPENAKTEALTEDKTSLDVDWADRCFMNPPYGRDISKWVQKANNEVVLGHADVVVCLVPARVDTRWWHNWCDHWPRKFLRGRLKFELNGVPQDAAPFPSALVYMGL